MKAPENTRQLLIDAAIEEFGKTGYDSTSTRRIADRAGVNVALIKYHFGSKDDLYRGAIEYLISLVSPRLEVITQMADSAKSIAGDDPLRQAQLMGQLIDNVLNVFLDNPSLQNAIPFVLRELFYPGPHFDRLYNALPRRLHELMTSLVSWILGLDPDSDAAKVRTHAVVGQVIVFHLGRVILCRRLELDAYNDEVKAEIRSQVKASVLASLELPHAV